MIVERDANEGVKPSIDFAFKVKVAVGVIQEKVGSIGEDHLESLMPDEIDGHGSARQIEETAFSGEAEVFECFREAKTTAGIPVLAIEAMGLGA